MLVRITSPDDGLVHFVNPAHRGYTLCSRTRGKDLLGRSLDPGVRTVQQVNCPECAKFVCAIRNEPYNALNEEVTVATMMSGIYAAIEDPTDPDTAEESSNTEKVD